MSGVQNPHDAFFKAVFHSPAAAADLLRRVLPPALCAAIDWGALEPLDGEYVDETLGGSRSDLVFRAPYADTAAYIAFMLEHQSTAERWMALRAVAYAVRFWQRHRRVHPEAQTLPLVISVVLHNGARPWAAPRTLEALLDLPSGLRDVLAPFVPRFELVLDDLARADDDEIEGSTRAALATAGLLLLKNAPHTEAWSAVIERLVPHLIAVARRPDGVEVLQQALVYSYSVSDLPHGSIESELSGQVPPHVEETIMTTAERLRQEGREQGIEQGIERGHRERTRLMLVRLLSMKIGPLPTGITDALETAGLDTLDRWFEECLTADALTLADVQAMIASTEP